MIDSSKYSAVVCSRWVKWTARRRRPSSRCTASPGPEELMTNTGGGGLSVDMAKATRIAKLSPTGQPSQTQLWRSIRTWVRLLATIAAIPKFVEVAIGTDTRDADAFM